ncbi:MAG: flavodoxin domain-containing protein [Clostridia bacterium]|nr:flavodoxin domain-containing protein [Clostridia bacterium]
MTIIYESNTGTAKRYAELLSEKLSCRVSALKDAEKFIGEEYVFVGWVMAGTIQGLSQAREKLGSLKAVCAVGMMPADKQEEQLKEKNAVSEPFFALPGDFDLKKLTGMYKMMMGMMMKMLKSKAKDDPKGAEAIELFEKGFSGYSEEAVEGILAFLKAE